MLNVSGGGVGAGSRAEPLLRLLLLRAERFASTLLDDGPRADRAVLLRPLNMDGDDDDDDDTGSAGRPAMPDCPVHVGVPMGTDRAVSPARRSSSAAS